MTRTFAFKLNWCLTPGHAFGELRYVRRLVSGTDLTILFLLR